LPRMPSTAGEWVRPDRPVDLLAPSGNQPLNGNKFNLTFSAFHV